MQQFRIKDVTGVKPASVVRLEDEAREVVAEAQATAEERSLARAKAKASDIIRDVEALERTKAKGDARAKARVEEEARIDAAGADQWFYIRNGEQLGPVTLAEMILKISDLTIAPPLNLVWTEGMDGWKPVYEVRKLCEPAPSSETAKTQFHSPVANPETMAKVAEEAKLAAAARVEESPRAADATEARLAAAENARTKATEGAKLWTPSEAKADDQARAAVMQAKAEEDAIAKAKSEAKLKAAEEALATAEANAAEQTKLRIAAEANAAQEGKLRAAAEANAAEEARIATARGRVKAEEEARVSAKTEAIHKASTEALAAELARATAEVKAGQEAKIREAAEAAAAEYAKLLAAAEATAAEHAQTAAAAVAKAKAEEQARADAAAKARLEAAELARATAEANAAEQAQLRIAAEANAAREAKLRAAAEIKAADEAEAAAAARAQKETISRAAAEVKLQAAEVAQASAEAIAAKESKLRTAADANAAKETKLRAAAEAKVKADDKAKTANKRKAAKDSVWFYTSLGDRLGPVNFEELRAMVAATSLDPRLDLVWKQGMEAWKPAGQIDGLFERTSVPVEVNKSLSPAVELIRPAKQTSRVPIPKIEYWPGARRRSLILIAVVFPYVWHHALGMLSPFLVKEFGPVLMGKILPFVAFVPLLALVHYGLKRLENLGMSRLWCLAVFAPVLNLWLGFRCFACPAGYAHHKKLDAPGVVLAIVYWLLALSVILILATYLALLTGAIESPALLEKIRALVQCL